MAEPSTSPVSHVQRPMIHEDEVHQLALQYGVPRRRVFNVQADEYIRTYRWQKDSDRRAEVVFAIQDARERVWVHAKSHYPSHIYRLPSGGIHWNETVEEALLREVDEETGLPVVVEGFVGLVEYRFHHNGSTAHFASYVFHLRTFGGEPAPRPGEAISAFRAVLPGQLAQVAADLRNLIGDRRGWGQWRALVHDLVYEYLAG